MCQGCGSVVCKMCQSIKHLKSFFKSSPWIYLLSDVYVAVPMCLCVCVCVCACTDVGCRQTKKIRAVKE